MKKIIWLFSCLLISSVCLITYAHSQADQYAQAESLFKDKRYDEVIRLLSDPASAEPGNFKLNILLAKAQIEKCAILKARGDKSYKTLVHQPYQKGRALHKIDKTRPEPYYIVARSLLINNRPYKAERAIKKALYFSPANAEYFVVLGDAYKAQAEMKWDSEALLSKAKDTYEKALKATEEKTKELTSIVEEKVKEVSEKLK
jgi:tetratricopeptide (TPR) repeat protein